eukprot:scaffold1446_cov391-Prasinococcus_capsulatus_cf.AAC.5
MSINTQMEPLWVATHDPNVSVIVRISKILSRRGVDTSGTQWFMIALSTEQMYPREQTSQISAPIPMSRLSTSVLQIGANPPQETLAGCPPVHSFQWTDCVWSAGALSGTGIAVPRSTDAQLSRKREPLAIALSDRQI